MTRMKRAVIGCIALMCLTACSDDGEAISPTTEVNAADCLSVSSVMLDALATGAQPPGAFRLDRGAAYRAPGFNELYFIAGQFAGPGFDEQSVGVWASNGLEPGEGIIMAVDAMAQEFTDWPDADTTQAAIKSTEVGVDEARACL